MKLNFLCKGHKKCDFPLISSEFSAKTGINYPDLEPGNKFWNRVQVPGSYYKSPTTTTTTTSVVVNYY